MRNLIGSALGLVALGIVIGSLVPMTMPVAVAGQTEVPRSTDGDPDLNGIWQAIGTAHWDLEDHSARAGGHMDLGRALEGSF